jgi:Myb/SANT-like DNA-binding domain
MSQTISNVITSNSFIVVLGFVWTYNTTLLLIEAYKANKQLLDHSAVTKVEVFKKVASELNSHGHNVTHHDCAIKIKNLIARFVIC